jgi:hypothetical protein
MEQAFPGRSGPPITLTLGEGSGAVTIDAQVIDGQVVAGDVVFGSLEELRAQGALDTEEGPQAATFRLPRNVWPDRRITYYIDPDASDAVRAMIEAAVDTWNEDSVITLVASTTVPSGDYLRFDVPSTDNCSDGEDNDEDDATDGADEECMRGYSSEDFSCYTTAIGKGTFGTTIHAEGCTEGNFRHEIGHAVGLYHELSRCDRDNHVEIHWENIADEWEAQYATWCSEGRDGQDLGPFDFDSVMLYGSGSETEPAWTDLAGGTHEGQRSILSTNDLLAVAWIYSVELVRAADIDGDNLDDLVVGVPQEDNGSTVESGGFHVMYGSYEGLSGASSEFWDQSSPGVDGSLDANDHMGHSLAIGDIDGDGYTDVVVGSPLEDQDFDSDSGVINVFYGSASGLTSSGDVWSQAHSGVKGTRMDDETFGQAVLIADYNGDGKGDVTIGIPGDSDTLNDAGAVQIIYGSGSGLGFGGDALFSQDYSGYDGDVQGDAEINDFMGSSLASGDFDDDGYADLAVGTPGEDVGTISNAGAVNVLYGSEDGLSASSDQLWYQDVTGVVDTCEASDAFGSAVAAGDFNCDGYDDLAAGVPGESVGSITQAGAVHIFYGSASGLTATSDLVIHANSANVPGTAEVNDHFGEALLSADLDWDGCDELVIGVPDEDSGTRADQGEVVALYGGPSGLLSVLGTLYTCIGDCEAGDQLGQSLSSADWNGDGYPDLAMGAPGEDVGTVSNAGAMLVAWSSAAGPSTTDVEVWYQGLSGLGGSAETTDTFGASMAQ